MGATLHAGERDVYLRSLLRLVRLVERTASQRASVRDRAQAPGQSQCAGDAGRFLSLDLNYGRRVDYEHRVWEDGRTQASGEVFGYNEISWHYYDRYRIPVMHTETNTVQGPRGDEAVYWLWKEWANVLRLRNDGVPILGFTWYSLTDQIDWDTALREANGRASAVGLFDLDRNIRPVGKAYQRLIDNWCEVLPTQSVCLRVPIVIPSESKKGWATRRRAEARTRRSQPPTEPTSTPGNP